MPSDPTERLEDGDVVLLDWPFDFSDEERVFLLEQRVARGHKNVSYRDGRVVGSANRDACGRLATLLARHARAVTAAVAAVVPRYARGWRVEATTLRPAEERGRALPTTARNDLLHIDAFPARPTRGDRILRAFTNVHLAEPRVWTTGEPFACLLDRALAPGGVAVPRASGPLARAAARLASRVVPALGRSPYDRFMLRLHDFLKRSEAYQQEGAVRRREFPPGATWLLFSDAVPHAATSGRGALEQTFFVPRATMRSPGKAPVTLLESRCGRPLAP